MHTKSELLELLRAHGIRLNKRLGQHYLIDPRLCARLVGLCDLSAEDTIIEIGAGLGALTDLLAARTKRVVAVEVDRAICELLKTRMAHVPNVEVHCQDILTIRWAEYPGSKVVGAIPYQITSPLLVSLCEHATDIPEAWLGLQREVAQRLCARPGTKAYGRLTILVQYRFAVQQQARIPRAAFFPQPEVDSVWLHLSAHHTPLVSVKDASLLFDVVRAAFSQRRKTLLNCLTQLARPRLTRHDALELIRASQLPVGIRGEELSLESFARLANTMVMSQFPGQGAPRERHV